MGGGLKNPEELCDVIYEHPLILDADELSYFALHPT